MTANALPAAAAAALLLLFVPTLASAADCPPGYSGFSLKPGTLCKQYVNCAGGAVRDTFSCPGDLIYSGKVGEGGICNWPQAVTCDDGGEDAAAAATPTVSIAAFNTPAAETPAAAAAATGGATDDPDLAALFQSWLEGRGSDDGDDGGGKLTIAAFNTASEAADGPPQGFCGTSWADASTQCRQTCRTDQDCCIAGEACFSTGSCSAATDGAGHYYCGATWCGAMQTCGVPCPSGTDEDCPVGQGCFADIPCKPSDLTEEEAAQWTQVAAPPAGGAAPPAAGTGGAAAAVPPAGDTSPPRSGSGGGGGLLPNPLNYHCGTDHADAAARCLPCPMGTMQECEDYTHGCFAGVDACAAGGGGAAAAAAPEPVVPAPAVPAPVVPAPVVPAPVPEPVVPAPVPEPAVPAPIPEPAAPAAPAPGPTGAWTNMPFNPSPSTAKKTVIGYYASWQWYDRDKLADPANLDKHGIFAKYGRINYAFFQPDAEGNLYGTDEWADPQLLWGPYDWSGQGPTHCSWDGPGPAGRTNCGQHQEELGIIALAHKVGTEVWPSIGGWTLSDNFPGIAASAARRTHFAKECVDLIKAYDFDGIDIDWEYPGYAAHSGTPADTVNYTLLLQEIRNHLDALGAANGRFYGLTAALPCGPDKIAKIEVEKISHILSELNLMTYDLHGSWDVLTGINAPMFDQGWGDKTPRWSVHGCVNNYVELGVPLGKLNMGLPFYGRSFRKATGMKQTHGGADDINYHLDEGSPQYFNIVNELKRLTTYRHENTQTQYAVFDDGGGLVSYDDPRAICDKAAYANERGMTGFLVWEISGDMVDRGNGQVDTPLIDATNNKVNNPSFDCSTLRDPVWALKDTTYRLAPPEPAVADMSGYVAPSGGGSANDFNGAVEEPVVSQYNTQVSIPAPVPTPAAPYVSPSLNAVYNQPEPAAPAVPAAAAGPSGGGCPAGGTGYFPLPGCHNYVYCQGGNMVGAKLPCVPGTLFDVNTNICNFAGVVSCSV